MAESKPRENAFSKALAMHVKKRAFDVKFELNVEDYTPIENIGIGAYGVVCSAVHNKTNDRVAIKKIPNVFDVKDIAKRTYREIKILKHFKHDNIIHIREALKPNESMKDFRDVYVVFDLMESDLHKIIYSKQELTEEHVRFFLYQILRGLKYIHSAQVIHRDLKPSNLLVNEDCQLKIGDFGMARGFSSSPSEPNFFMTQYVATRWYRAPEIMLSLIEYGAAVDMWSVGCIFAEMLGRKHLFPGKDAISQIKLIIGIAGSPDQSLLQLCHSPIIRNFIQEMGQKEAIPWSKLFPKASKKAIHLLSRMLVLHPKDRITVEKALVHPYLNKYHDPDDEPICVPVFNFDFENEDLNLPQLREVIHKEIMEYHQPRTPTLSFNALLRPVPKSPDVIPDLKIDPSKGQLLQLTRPGKVIPEVNLELKSSKEKESELMIKTGSLQDDGVFKRPLSAKNEEATVRVDVKDLIKVDANDIEMLSAKSTDVKPMSGMVTEVKVAKENQEPVKEDKNKTVSEDTKNQIRAALKNASFRKRTDSVGDDERRKPITAAMRQKEREDRRKKKFERTIERKKKDKKKTVSNEILTSEDKELLERWAKMQKVNVPIAPKPAAEGTVIKGQGQDVSEHAQPMYNTTGRQSDGSNSSNQVKGDISKGSGQGQSDISRGEGHGGCDGSRAVQPETMNLLQQRLLSGIHDNRNNGNQGLAPQLPTEGDRSIDSSNTASTGTLMQSNFPGYMSQASNDNCEQNQSNLGSGSFAVDFSSVPLGELDFLSMVTSPELTNTVSVSHSDPTNQLHSQQSLGMPNALLAGDGAYNKTSSEAEGGSFLQRLCSQTSPPQSVGAVGHLPLPESVEHRSPSHLSVSPGYPNSVSPSNIYSSHSPGSQHSVSPNLSASPSHPFESSLNTVQQQQHPQQQLLQQLHQHGNQQQQQYQQQHQQQSANMPFQMNTMILNQSDPNKLFLSASQAQNQSASVFLNTNLSENQSGGTHPVPHFPFGSTSPGFQTQENGNQFSTQPGTSYQTENQAGSLSGPSFQFGSSTAGYQAQSTTQSGTSNLYRNQSTGTEGQESHNNSSNSNSPPALSINTRQAQLSYQQLFQPMPGPSEGVTDMTQTQVDLVALLTKQFSKSNVDDICPQLALTPRGTGGGYGVGVDLDSIMTGQEADSNTGEPPLSSSILADWMEEIGNMNIDIEALEQELQSPMVLSYNDLNLYSS